MSKDRISDSQLALHLSVPSNAPSSQGKKPLSLNQSTISLSCYRRDKLSETQNELREKVLSRASHLIKA